ncbi:MAG: hypothetical protein A2168_02030 [Planctomycetes bacterium RBG_13_50_24]|nr:MAG: hypothetical protein A2168_02030 [Planctomycetes bacterium RBG_13_50_24]
MRRKSVVFVLFVAIMSTCAFGIVGTPTAELNKGQWKLGYNYTYSDIDLDETKGVQAGMYLDENDDLVRWGSTSKVKLKEFKIDRTYFTIGYGICDNWEVYGQLGCADAKEKEKWFNNDKGEWYKWLGYDFDYDFAWGWGTRITLAQQDKMKWGVSAQMNFHDSNLEEKIPETGYYYYKETSELETWDLLIAAGPTIDMGGWKLYGGGFYYDIQGEISWKGFISDDSTWKGSYDFEAAGNIGGFIGAQFALIENLDVTTEFSATADSWAVGAGIAGKF